MDFEDTKNGITAFYEIGNGGVRKNPADYLKGEILQNGNSVANIWGNYMGFLDINGERLWDVRE